MTPLDSVKLKYPLHDCKSYKNKPPLISTVKHSKEPEDLINKYIKNYEKG